MGPAFSRHATGVVALRDVLLARPTCSCSDDYADLNSDGVYREAWPHEGSTSTYL